MRKNNHIWRCTAQRKKWIRYTFCPVENPNSLGCSDYHARYKWLQNIVWCYCLCDWERNCALPGWINKRTSGIQDFIGIVPTSVLVCKQLKEEYRKIASIKGNVFIAASDYAVASSIDDEHLTEEGHAVLADILYKKLIDMGVIWYISPIYYDTMCSCSSNIIMYRCLSIF